MTTHELVDLKKLDAAIAEAKARLASLESLRGLVGGSTMEKKKGRKRGRAVKTAAVSKPPKVVKKRKRAGRGAVKEAILKFLVSKGPGGAHVKEIAAAINSRPTNVTSFFYSRAQKINKTIKILGGARFAYVPKD